LKNVILDESSLITLMRESWNEKLNHVITFGESIEFAAPTNSGNERAVISQGLKVLHKKSKLLYTVSEVGSDECVLKTPEGKDVLVGCDELEKEYEIA
jgi:hypothetical protein